MKKFKLYAAVILSALIAFTSCKQETPKVKVQTVILSSSEVSIVKGTTFQITAKVLPADADIEKAEWSVNNSNVKISDEGLLTAVEVGESTVTYTADGVSASCKVTVTPDVILPESVSIVPNTLELNFEKSYQLDYGILPKNATDKSVIWKSSDEEIVTVDKTGKITGVGIGKATVTVTTSNGKEGTCEVSVIGKVVETIYLLYSGYELEVGDMDYQFVDEILPADAEDKRLEWKSMDENVVTVEWDEENQRAIFTAVGEGYTQIVTTAKSNPEVSERTWVSVTADTPVPFRFAFEWKLIDCKFQPDGMENPLSIEEYLAYLKNNESLSEEDALAKMDMLERYISYNIMEKDTDNEYVEMTVTDENKNVYKAKSTKFEQVREGNDVYNYDITFDFQADTPQDIKDKLSLQRYVLPGDGEQGWVYGLDFPEQNVKVLYTFRSYGKSILG